MISLDQIVERARRRQEAPKRPRSLENYVQATKEIVLDKWQRHLCHQLELAFWLSQYDKFESQFTKIDHGFGEPYQISPSGFKIPQAVIDERKNQGTRVAIHAPPQFGKSIIISQCYPAWILAWDPLHRFRLATYNVFHSTRFSVVVKHLMRSAEHLKIFPDIAGHLPARSRFVEWSTNARMGHPDGQASFTALGLQSGFVGTGYDTLLMDDPYKSAEEAMSDVIRDKTWRFWTDTASVRANERSNVFIMFHRYHQDDMGGRAIASGEFGLLRYAAQADGDYEDDESGRRFGDPMNRLEGEYLSPRFGEGYYLRQKKNEQAWYSQFQGRPAAKSGKMFDVTKIADILPANVPQILHYVRAWDNAATEAGGAFTAGVKMGVDAAENVYIFNVEREQVDTAGRHVLQETTAERDGKLVQIHVPQDPGSAGVDVAFQFKQDFSQKGFIVHAEKVSGNKQMRAYSASKAVNSSKVFLVLNADGTTPKWHKAYKNELRYFPASTFKDQVDATADAYNHLMRLFFRGLVIKNFNEYNLLHRSLFVRKFGEKVPEHWEVAAAVRFGDDSSQPSGYAISARAAENAHIGEAVFIVAAARMFVESPIQVLDALHADLRRTCAKGVDHPHVTWLNRGASANLQVTAQKLDIHLTEFLDEAVAGIPETNYYLQKIPIQSPFYNHGSSTRCQAIVEDDQYPKNRIRDELGMISLRQDAETWSYNDRGEPQPFGGIVLDCVRMTLYKFALSATNLSPEERRLAKLSPDLQPEAVRKKLGTPEFVEAVFAQEHALAMIRMQEEEEKRDQFRNAHRNGNSIGARAVMRRHRKSISRAGYGRH